MSFQILISTFRRNLSSIESISTLGDITVICQTYITLTAILQGDITGHTFEWEQTSGFPVDWVGSRFSTTVTFSQTIKNDKTFRFWVDRGTAIQRFRDVNVWNTPTELITASISVNAVQFSQPWLTSSEEVISFLPVPGNIVLTEDPSFWGYAPEAISWTVPSAPGKTLWYSTLEENSTGQFAEIGRIYAPNQTKVEISDPTGKSYRVWTFYKTGGVVTYSLSEMQRFSKKYYLYASAFESYNVLLNLPNDPGFTTTFTSRQLKVIGNSNPEFLEEPTANMSLPPGWGFTTTFTSRQLKVIGNSNPEFLEEPTANMSLPSEWGFTINIIERKSSTIGG